MMTSYIRSLPFEQASKLETASRQLSVSGRSSGFFPMEKKKEESKLAECVRASAKTSMEVVSGLASQVVKSAIFNTGAILPPAAAFATAAGGGKK